MFLLRNASTAFLYMHYNINILFREGEAMPNRKQIGCFSSSVIELLGLSIPLGTPIYISDTNIDHMRSSHPEDFKKYGNNIEDIITHPDYVGQNNKNDSIEFIKEYIAAGDSVKVAVRVTTRNVYYARSMYALNPNRVKNFIRKGTLKKLDK